MIDICFSTSPLGNKSSWPVEQKTIKNGDKISIKIVVSKHWSEKEIQIEVK